MSLALSSLMMGGGSLNVANEIEVLKKFVSEGIDITRVQYTVTLKENSYVSPYTYYTNDFIIPESDRNKYGELISICGTGLNGAPIPTCFDFLSNNQIGIIAVDNSSTAKILVTFLKIKK